MRPKNLDLFTIRFPLPAIVSILHRLSGLMLFFIIPALIGVLQYSLSYSGFETLQIRMNDPWVKFCVWLLFLPFCYHLIAGVRHLLMDVHVGTTLKSGRGAAKLVFILFIASIIILGIWLW